MLCLEVKVSEGEEVVNGYYWLDCYNIGEVIQIYCYIGKGLCYLCVDYCQLYCKV